MGRKRRKLQAQWIVLSILLIVALFLAVGGQVSAANVQRSQVANRSMSTQALSYPPGVPAIHPHLVTTNVAGTAPQPTFTTADVVQYVTQHPLQDIRASVTGSVKVVQVSFMTSDALSAKLNGESIGRPAMALVCYVELQGTFSFASFGNSSAVHTAYEVFDAQTGNLILAGGTAR